MAGQPFILIVDDESDFREIFSTKLRAEGFKVDVAENGQIALDKLAKMTPDLVLMDVKMPVLDGPTTILKMKESPATKNIKVVFLTSLGDPRSEMQEINRKFSQEFGAYGYLKKTDDLNTLVQKVRELLA